MRGMRGLRSLRVLLVLLLPVLLVRLRLLPSWLVRLGLLVRLVLLRLLVLLLPLPQPLPVLAVQRCVKDRLIVPRTLDTLGRDSRPHVRIHGAGGPDEVLFCRPLRATTRVVDI
ncbi:hypothetical protein F5Y14DRAFT_407219 [Nemania sp. NC0429]|nr:hypothetical protein F5Y14DRAFT_407219 [Nemania sp. NC0429]